MLLRFFFPECSSSCKLVILLVVIVCQANSTKPFMWDLVRTATWPFFFFFFIQLFRERLSYKGRKAYVTMSKVILGNGGLWLLDWSSSCFSVVERNSTNTCIPAFTFLVAESLWTSIKQSQILATHDTNQHCHVRFYTFVRQPLPKQLYLTVYLC